MLNMRIKLEGMEYNRTVEEAITTSFAIFAIPAILTLEALKMCLASEAITRYNVQLWFCLLSTSYVVCLAIICFSLTRVYIRCHSQKSLFQLFDFF